MFNDDIINKNIIEAAKINDENFQKVIDNQILLSRRMDDIESKLDQILRLMGD